MQQKRCNAARERDLISVLCLTWEYPPRIAGGLGIACHLLNRALGNNGQARMSLAIPFEGPLDTAGLSDWWAAFPASSPTSPSTDWNPYSSTVQRSGDFGRACIAQFSSARFDLVHAHDWLTFPAAMHLRRMHGVAFVAHMHSLEVDRAGTNVNPSIVEIERAGLVLADHIIAVSEFTKQRIVSCYGVSPAKISTIHNGIAVDDTADRWHGLPLSNRSRRATFVGRLTFQKAPDVFIRTACLLHENQPDLRFSIVGSGDQHQRLIALADRLLPGGVLTFHGFLDHAAVREILADSRVLIVPSVSEPFGLVAAEAVSAGTPVVLSSRCGIREILPSLLCANSFSPEAFANSTRSLLENEVYADELRRRAFLEARSATWAHAALKTREIYRAALERQPPLATSV